MPLSVRLDRNSVTTVPALNTARPADGRATTASTPALAKTLVSFSLFYIGLYVTLRGRVNMPIWHSISLGLVVPAAISLEGWRRLAVKAALRRYLGWAIALSAWIILSSVASWQRPVLSTAVVFAALLLFVVPGMASLFVEPVHRDALVSGVVIGAAAFGVVTASRALRGLSVFDVSQQDPNRLIIGVNRNYVIISALVAVPFLLTRSAPRLVRPLRWVLLGLSVACVVFSGSRAGLLGLVFVAIVYVLVQPGGGRKLKVFFALCLAAIVVVIGAQQIGGQATLSTERLLHSTREESTGDEARTLLLRKAWHLALRQPVFGIGVGQFVGAYDPVVDDARTHAVRLEAQYLADHNGYAGLMAEAGFPALVLYLLLLAALIRSGVTHRASVSARAATSALASVLFFMIAPGITRDDPLFFCTAALVLGVATALESRNESAPDIRLRSNAPIAGTVVLENT